MTTSTTTRLLDAAEFRMRRGGYNAVSFRDLASDTNIKSSSVHYHYPRKEDLAVALIQRYREQFFEALDKNTRSANEAESKLRAFRLLYRKALIKDGALCLCGLLGAEAAGLPPSVRDAVNGFFAANIEWVSEALPASMPMAERRKAARRLVATYQGGMMLAKSMDDPKLFDAIATTAIEQSPALNR